MLFRSEDDEKRSRAYLREEEGQRRSIVGRGEACFDGVGRAGQLASPSPAARRPDESAGHVIERQETCAVSSTERDVGRQESCVERMVDAGEPLALAAHTASNVEREDDALIAFGLVLADGRVIPASGSAPVDVADLVAALIGPEALELGVSAAYPKRAQSRILPPLPPQHLERARGVHVWVDVGPERHEGALLAGE